MTLKKKWVSLKTHLLLNFLEKQIHLIPQVIDTPFYFSYFKIQFSLLVISFATSKENDKEKEGAVTDRICQKWLQKFHAGDLSLEDAPWLGRSEEVYSDQIKTLIENKQYTMWEIANILKISTSRAENNMYQLGYVYHFDV